MEVFIADIVTEEHKSVLLWAVAVVAGRAIESLMLTIDVGVVKQNFEVIGLHTSLEADSFLVVDASDVMSSHLLSLVHSGEAGQRGFVA